MVLSESHTFTEQKSNGITQYIARDSHTQLGTSIKSIGKDASLLVELCSNPWALFSSLAIGNLEIKRERLKNATWALPTSNTGTSS